MLRKYRHPLRAWRCLLDTDDSNQVSWSEFQTACAKVNFHGNVAGAWRMLDADLSSTISLREIDAPSAALLSSFKDWTEMHFGSVQLAFKAIDRHNGGALLYSELKHV